MNHAKVDGTATSLAQDPKLNGMNGRSSADDDMLSEDEAPSDQDLLKEIFKSTSTKEDSSHACLGSEVAERASCRASASQNVDKPFTSKLGQRIWRRYQSSASDSGDLADFEVARLSDDFLRLPIASDERTKKRSSRRRPDLANTDELEQLVMKCHLDLETRSISDSSLMMDETQIETMPSSSLMDSTCFSRILKRVPYIGLGMSLREYDGCVYIQALLRRDGTRLVTENLQDMTGLGPAARAGLLPGDRLLGLNGQPFLKQRIATLTLDEAIDEVSSEEVLKSVGDALSRAKSPVVLHAQRYRNRKPILATLKKLADAPQREIHAARSASVNGYRRGPFIHPFAKALSKRNLIKTDDEELLVTRQIRTLTDRTRQWESKLSFRLRASDHKLRPLLDARDVDPAYYASFVTEDGECPPYFHYKEAKSLHSFAPSTPMIHDWREGRAFRSSPARRVSREMSREAAVLADLHAGLDENDREVQDMILGTRSRGATTGSGGLAYPTPDHRGSRQRSRSGDPTDIFVPLMSVRKAICVRILNTFLDNRNRTAFTIWCLDIESGMEWYAPARYYDDFKELRSSLSKIDRSFHDIPFPSTSSWGFSLSSETRESEKTKEARRSQLEIFLRRAFASYYRGHLHPNIAEIAVHLQTFVGCDTALDGGESKISLSRQVAITESSYGKRVPSAKSEPDNTAQINLKRSVQRYVYRLFLLPAVEALTSTFVKTAIDRAMSEGAVPPSPSKSHQVKIDRSVAETEVEKIRDFIDQVQELVLQGCRDDLISIAQRRDFVALVDDDEHSIRDGLFRDAVREQTEIEIYVPLRSAISKYLVHAHFNEDVEIKYKVRYLMFLFSVLFAPLSQRGFTFNHRCRHSRTNPRVTSGYPRSTGPGRTGGRCLTSSGRAWDGALSPASSCAPSSTPPKRYPRLTRRSALSSPGRRSSTARQSRPRRGRSGPTTSSRYSYTASFGPGLRGRRRFARCSRRCATLLR